MYNFIFIMSFGILSLTDPFDLIPGHTRHVTEHIPTMTNTEVDKKYYIKKNIYQRNLNINAKTEFVF